MNFIYQARLVIVFFMAAAFLSCGSSSSDSKSSTALEAFTGTVAFPVGSGTLSLDVGAAAKSASNMVMSKAAGDTVTGIVNYDGIDYIFAGTYDTATGAVDGTATYGSDVYNVNGTYSAAEGFQGTITLNGSIDTEKMGTASALGSTTAGVAAIMIYEGTISGPVTGTWTMALAEDGTLAGSYCGIYTHPDFGDLTVGGTLSGTVNSDNTVTLDQSTTYYWMGSATANPIAINLTGAGTYAAGGTSISGTWDSDPVDSPIAGMYPGGSGTWTCTNAK